MGNISDWGELKTSLKQKGMNLVESFDKREFRYIQNGLKCFNALHRAKRERDYEFFSSQVCRAEMHRVILEAHAHNELHRIRIPLSLQENRPLILFRRVLDDSDYGRIDQQIEDFFNALRFDFGIDIKNVEDESHGNPTSIEAVFLIARAIWSRVLTQTMDAYIYAAAVACQADYFLTSDEALRETANRFSNPNDNWKQVAVSLRKELGLPKNQKLPIGCRLNVTLP